MKNKLLMGAAALALLGALGHFGAKPLLAQIRAALVKNIDERGRVPYMVQATCSVNGFECLASFPAVPANKRFVIEYVNAQVQVPPSAMAETFLHIPSLPTGVVFTTHLVEQDQAFGSLYSVSTPVVLYGEAGEVLICGTRLFTASGGMVGFFTLSGYLVDLTQ
jgi:hypothetical protein